MPVSRRLPRFLPGVAVAVWFAAAADAATRFGLLPGWGAAVVLAAAIAAAAVGFQVRDRIRRVRLAAVLFLGLGAAASLAPRLVLPVHQASSPDSARRAAARVEVWLAERTRAIGDTAYLMARAPTLAAALEGSDAVDYRAQAFETLGSWPLPQTAIGPAGATIYDARLRPVAWSGRSADLGEALASLFPEGVRDEYCPDSATPLFLPAEAGGRSVLAVAECTRNRLGLVTVELPLTEAPPPATGGGALSALVIAAGRGLSVRMPEDASELEDLAGLFERRGNGFLEGAERDRLYHFPLRAYDGQLLGAASTPVAPPAARRAEQQAERALFAALAALLSGLLGAVWLFRLGRAGAFTSVAVVRLGLASVSGALPASLPFLPASFLPGALPSPLPGLADSPLAAALTGLAAFLMARIVEPTLRRRAPARLRPFEGAARGGAAAIVLLLGALAIDAMGHSGATPLFPTWRLGIGWPEILGWSALLLVLAALLLLAAALLRPAPRAWLFALVTITAAAAGSDAGATLLLALVPLGAAAAFVATRRGRVTLHQLGRPLLRQEPGMAFFFLFGLFAATTVVWVPAMQGREEAARRRFAEDAAPVMTLSNRFAVCHALREATLRLDEEVARMGPLRGDTAYRLWAGTGLARLTAASALEVLGPGGAVSRFGVGFPRRPDPLSSAPPGLDWSPAAGCGEPQPAPAPATLETRRRSAAGHILTLRVLDSPDSIPFLPREAGVADHFLSRGGAAPGVFQTRDLRLTPGPPPASESPGRNTVPITAGDRSWTVSWRRDTVADHLGGLLGWGCLATLLALLVAGVSRLRLLLPGRFPPRRRSFQMQLTEALAAAVLVAILGLAVFAQYGLGASLSEASDVEALRRSGVVERVAREAGALNPSLPRAELGLRLAQTADQAATEAALYVEGRLAGASRPELALIGLLPARPPPDAALSGGAVGAPTLSVHEVGELRYRIVWTPLPGVGGPLLSPVLAVPLPADEPARAAGVRALQRTLLLGSVALTLVFAMLAPTLVARRLAAPVRSLARATGAIADGALDTEVPTERAPAEVRLLAASVERLIRRIPSVRRRMREEAARDLTRRVAHDIKNALAPIAIEADTIRRVLRDPRRTDPRPDVEESVRDIVGQVERLRRISSEFSAVGAELVLEATDGVALVRRTLGPYLRARTGPRVHLRAPVHPVRVVADPEIVARIVENLIRNAVEALGDAVPPGMHSPRRGIEVRVSAPPERGTLRVEIEDDGPGVPENLRERIFDAAFSTRTRGSGLGLANARRFTEAHGGRLRARRRRDGRSGLLMVLDLPIDGPGGGAA